MFRTFKEGVYDRIPTRVLEASTAATLATIVAITAVGTSGRTTLQDKTLSEWLNLNSLQSEQSPIGDSEPQFDRIRYPMPAKLRRLLAQQGLDNWKNWEEIEYGSEIELEAYPAGRPFRGIVSADTGIYGRNLPGTGTGTMLDPFYSRVNGDRITAHLRITRTSADKFRSDIWYGIYNELETHGINTGPPLVFHGGEVNGRLLVVPARDPGYQNSEPLALDWKTR